MRAVWCLPLLCAASARSRYPTLQPRSRFLHSLLYPLAVWVTTRNHTRAAHLRRGYNRLVHHSRAHKHTFIRPSKWSGGGCCNRTCPGSRQKIQAMCICAMAGRGMCATAACGTLRVTQSVHSRHGRQRRFKCRAYVIPRYGCPAVAVSVPSILPSGRRVSRVHRRTCARAF